MKAKEDKKQQLATVVKETASIEGNFRVRVLKQQLVKGDSYLWIWVWE